MKPVEDNVDDDLETSATSKPTPTPPEAAGKGVFFLKKINLFYLFLFHKIWSIFQIVFHFSFQNWQYSHPTNPQRYLPTDRSTAQLEKKIEFVARVHHQHRERCRLATFPQRQWLAIVEETCQCVGQCVRGRRTTTDGVIALDATRPTSQRIKWVYVYVCSRLMMINDDVAYMYWFND